MCFSLFAAPAFSKSQVLLVSHHTDRTNSGYRSVYLSSRSTISAVICKNKAPSAMGFEPMTPDYESGDNQSSCIYCCRCLYGSGFLPRRRTAHCRTHIRVTKSHQRQGTIFRWESNPRHEDFQSPAIPLSYCMGCCWCLCDPILPSHAGKIVEKKLRTQIFTSGFATFSVFQAAHTAFSRNPPGKPPSKPGQRREHGSEALSRPPAHSAE